MSYVDQKMSAGRVYSIIARRHPACAARLCVRDGPRLQVRQERRRGSQDVRRAGGAAAPGGAAAAAARAGADAAAGDRTAAAAGHARRLRPSRCRRRRRCRQFIPTPPAPPAPPAPPPAPRTVEPARARSNLQSYFSTDDYPSSAIRGNEEGTAAFRLTVGANGRVSDCSITSSSGSAALDAATCRILRSRARFTPARDNTGQPTNDTVSSRIRWVLPED